jgi:hypothetical protein
MSNNGKKSAKSVPRAGRLRAPKKGENKMPAKRKVGFVGGLNKLRERKNKREVSDPNAKPQPKITKSVRMEYDAQRKMHIQRQVLRQQAAEKRNPYSIISHSSNTSNTSNTSNDMIYEVSEISEESELETMDSENEDMERFCRRMCKKTQEAKDDEINRQKTAEEQNFRTARNNFMDDKLGDFRARVKSNVAAGKLVLMEYKTNDTFEGYTIKKILTELLDEKTGLKIMTDYVNPFRLFHYSHKKNQYIIEITWATPSAKGAKIAPNKLPPRRRRVRSIQSEQLNKLPNPDITGITPIADPSVKSSKSKATPKVNKNRNTKKASLKKSTKKSTKKESQ